MPDLLVNLLKLPPLDAALEAIVPPPIIIRRAQPFELTAVRSFVEGNFSVSWADEISVGFGSKPVSVYIAVEEKQIIGFAACSVPAEPFSVPPP